VSLTFVSTGFLSESADFARACDENGLIFIGPKAEHIELFGDKITSKNAMKEIGVPVLEGTSTPITDKKEAEKISQEIGFPVIIKAAFGGGGIVNSDLKKTANIPSKKNKIGGFRIF